MVDFSLSDEERQIRDTVRSFIEKEVMPLEPEVLRNERAGRPGLEVSTLRELQNKAHRRPAMIARCSETIHAPRVSGERLKYV